MGNIFCNCFSTSNQQRMSMIFPDQHIFSKVEAHHENDEKFYHLPEKQKVDKTLDFLDSNRILNDKDYDILVYTLTHLLHIRNKFIINKLIMSPFSDTTSNHSDISPVKSETTIDSPLPKSKIRIHNITTFTMASSHIEGKEIQEALIIMEVQEGLFMHPDVLKKNKLSRPFVSLQLCPRTKDNNPESQVNYATSDSEDILVPSWNELFEHVFIECGKLAEWQIAVSLHYHKGRSDETVQIGNHHTFPLNLLLDQNVYAKQINFKDSIAKGVLAKVLVRFQLVYDLQVLKRKLLYELDSRILRFQRLQEGFLKKNKRKLIPTTLTEIYLKSHESSFIKSGGVLSDNYSVFSDSSDQQYYIT